jgi:hypothetical protein
MVDRFRRGKRIYTHWDRATRQVTVASRAGRAADSAAPVVPVADDTTHYADGARIAHSGDEFVLDFVAQTGGRARGVSRVIMSPGSAKRLAALLEKMLS